MALPAHPVRRVLLPALLILLAGCAVDTAPVAATQAAVTEALAPVALDARVDAAAAIAPAVLDVREAVQQAAALIAPGPAAAAPAAWAGTEAATKLIVRWEVTSAAAYTRRYQGVICPGGASGPTIGIGYDLGHQTRAQIQADWAPHPDVERLMDGSGVVGEAACRRYRAEHLDIRVPYSMAEHVFAWTTLPAYTRTTRRAFANGWEGIGPNAQAANVSLIYNRGASMAGARNREKRAIRDTCVPRGDVGCNAAQLRAMCRIWAGTPNGPGLCARRHDEARTAEAA